MFEGRLVLRGAVGAEKVVDHRDRPAVVLDHVGEKEPVKRRALGLVEFLYLLRCEHPGHVHEVIASAVYPQSHPRDVDFEHRLPAIAELLLHRGNLVLLRLFSRARRCIRIY